MADGSPKVDNQQSLPTLTDEQIVTERKSLRRSFLTATGAALLVGGAAALVSGCGNDPDKAKSQTPVQAAPQAPAEDPDKAKTK
jgi:hypothetical protein